VYNTSSTITRVFAREVPGKRVSPITGFGPDGLQIIAVQRDVERRRAAPRRLRLSR